MSAKSAKRPTRSSSQGLLRGEQEEGGESCLAEEAAKPRLVLPVSQETAEMVRLRPESVRLSTIRDDGVPVLERVRPREIVQPLEVDVNGRIARARVVDCALRRSIDD